MKFKICVFQILLKFLLPISSKLIDFNRYIAKELWILSRSSDFISMYDEMGSPLSDEDKEFIKKRYRIEYEAPYARHNQVARMIDHLFKHHASGVQSTVNDSQGE